MLLIAQRESVQLEKERQQKERALLQAEYKKKQQTKMYDDIVFDSSAIREIHPRLHQVQVHLLRDVQFSIDSVEFDSEYIISHTQQQDEEEYYEGPAVEAPAQTKQKDQDRQPAAGVTAWFEKADQWFIKQGF